jgi:MFS family permease
VLYVTGTRYEKKEEPHAGNSMRETISGLIPIMIIMFLAAASYRMISSFATTHLTNLGLSIELANMVVTAMMVTGILGAVLSGFLTDRFGERNTILSSCLLLTLTSTVTIFIDEVCLLVPVICIMGFPLLEFWPAFYSHIAKVASKSSMAFTYGTIFAVTWGGGALFPYIGGVVADLFGLKSIYTIVAVLSLIAIIITYFKLEKGVKKEKVLAKQR